MANVVDYFFVCGVPKNKDYLIPENVKSVHDGFVIKPKLLEHYPETVPDNPWRACVRDEAALMELCVPGGLRCRYGEADVSAPKFHSFLLTRQDGFRTYGHVLTYYELMCDIAFTEKFCELHDSVNEPLDREMYTQKAVCLFTRLSYISTCERVLHLLYKIFVEDKGILSARFPIESYVFNLLNEMPVPSPGNSIALIWDSEKPIVLHQPAAMELPFIDVHLSSLFTLLGSPINVLRLLTSVFLEHQILLMSKDCHKLIVVAEAVMSLAFPFHWPHPYAPVLPFSIATNFLDAPVPFIMGISLDASEETNSRFISKFDQCFVDIDKSRVMCPEGQPDFPNQIAIVQQLSRIISKHTRQISKIHDNKNFDVSEKPESAVEADEVIEPSPPMHRRNAKKRHSRADFSDAAVTIQLQSPDVSAAASKESLEDLKNLHANARSDEALVISELKSLKPDEIELHEQMFNIKVREIVLGSLVSLFSQYDKFVIHPDVDEAGAGDSWYLTRETQQNFDKASFLSDQPEYHLKFLSAFLETQMFASLIDLRIVSQLDPSTKESHLSLFDERIKQAKSMPRQEPPGTHQEIGTSDIPPSVDFLSRSMSTISSGQSAKQSIEKWIKASESAFKRRFTNVSGRYPGLRLLEVEEKNDTSELKEEVPVHEGAFPGIVHPSILQNIGRNTQQKVLQSSVVVPDIKWQETRKMLNRQPSMSEFSPEVIAKTNWKFLEKLLRDVKLKTKKLLVRKMGQEAIELGHTESSIMGLEENTLIGSLCDLLERIWCHGLHANHKRGKSALWSHLLKYEEDTRRIVQIPKHMLMDTAEGPKLVSLGHHSKSMSSLAIEQPPRLSPQLERRPNAAQQFDRRMSQPVLSADSQNIQPISTDIINNIKLIQKLKEVQTDIGKCRAWIRLALEQKQLQVHLSKLLSNRPLLQTMYKRYSLLRCDDEREQFLYHLLSLNAVEFSCFTNSFTKTVIPYRVWIFPKKQISGVSQTSANVHVIISGELACTGKIAVPKGCTEFTFQHQNLGVLTTMILGHDNAGMLPKWLVDFLLIRNEVTGQAYFFPCCRWLGRSVDDGGTQRLLLARSVPYTKDLNDFIFNRAKNQSANLTSLGKTNNVHDLLERVGQAANAIVKYFHKPPQEKLCPAALTGLLCKPSGLVPALIQALQHGLKSAGFFRKQIFAWDVVSAACQVMLGEAAAVAQQTPLYRSTLSSIGDMIRNVSPQRTLAIAEKTPSPGHSGRSSPQISHRDDDGPVSSTGSEDVDLARKRLLELHGVLTRLQADHGLGKDDVFQLLVCVGLREHLLPQWFKLLSMIVKHSTQLYEADALMCNSQSVGFLVRVLNNFSEYKIDFEPILMRGLDQYLSK